MNKGREEVNKNDPKQEPPPTKTTEIVRYYHEENKDVHEERRLRIEELDEWREHKPRTHDKLKVRKNKPNTFPNQLQVSDTVLLDIVDPHIVTTTPNEEIPLTVLSSFPFGTVEVSHPKFSTFKEKLGHGIENHERSRDKARFYFFNTGVRYARAIKSWTTTHGRATIKHGSGRRARRPRSFPQKDVGDRVLPRYELQPKFGTRSLNFHKLRKRRYFKYYAYDPSPQVVMTNNDDPGNIHFRLGRLVRAMSVPEFGVALGLYTDEFMEEEDINALQRFGTTLFHLQPQPLEGLSPHSFPTLPPCHLGIHIDLEEREPGVVTTHDAYYLWCMANAHVTNLAYFISFTIHHQTEWHKKGVISIGPYVTRLARHFGLLNTAAQSSALTLIGQMSPQGITTMLQMQMVEYRRGTYPPQYRLSHVIDEEDLEDIPDDVPPQHKEPSTTPPRERAVPVAASLAHLSDRLAHFEQII
ncbi:hypothetical protein GOBAR_AA14779 [Gossypium barbadense]|uniref:Uncharacterized protein n=1 Tax=Gossypium barbadense TaxID=3634 RepID=A0A2P5XRA5_GOSBA|nr:hypothetical protein GOBAR_AA14779 [Gossypium barbadense]